jgi:hypothetical protein
VLILLFLRRIQIHLEEELADALARDARVRGVSKAALIREYLAGHVRAGGRGDDPAQRLIGAYDGRRDDSASVDGVAYGA